MNAELEKKLRTLDREALLDWVLEKTARRGEEYRDRVGEIVSAGDFLAAKVRGTADYTTNVFVDSYGEILSVCTCPVGMNCKHGVALALRAAAAVRAGGTFPEADPEGWRLDREAIIAAKLFGRKKESEPPPPPPKEVRVQVETNPFDRFTPKGGRHGPDFSFRVEAEGEVFHWPFLVATLFHLLAKGGLEYGWHSPNGERDNPLFTCTCGDAGCEGLDRQTCTMTADRVVLAIEQYGRPIAFEFDRVRFEGWAMEALRRMRGSPRLRRDPWGTLVSRESFEGALETLLAARPRCRAIWERLKTKRRLDDDDFAELSAVSPDEGAAVPPAGDFAAFFGGSRAPDLGSPETTWAEDRRIAERMNEETVMETPMCIYGTLYGKGWKPVCLRRGQELAYVREPADEKGRPGIRVEDAAANETLGHLKYDEARFLTALMDRRGLVLRNHVESFERFEKILPVRIDFDFRDPSDRAFDWGGSLDGKDRLYFEMLRAVALKPGLVPAAQLRDEIETVGRIVRDVTACPEIAFLAAWILASAKEIELRLTAEETAKRRAYCDAVRRALACEPVGGLLSVGEVSVLPLRAKRADGAIPPGKVLDRVRSFVRLSWTNHDLPRPRVELPEFPADATGFAAFRGRELLDVCLTGIPLAGSDLFDNFALYDRPSETAPFEDAKEAFAATEEFLVGLPIRERDKDGRAPRFWLERGIHNGTYELDDAGRLVALRIVRMAARKQWVD